MGLVYGEGGGFVGYGDYERRLFWVLGYMMRCDVFGDLMLSVVVVVEFGFDVYMSVKGGVFIVWWEM